MAEEKCSQRTRFLSSRTCKSQAKVSLSSGNIWDAIEQFSKRRQEEGRAPSRMKLVVKKEDLKEVLEAITGTTRAMPAGMSLEHRVNLMKRRQVLRGRTNRGSWRPVLQTIPE